MTDAAKSQCQQFSQSQSQMASTENCNQMVKKKSYNMFDELYDILNRITTENDFDALNFALKEKFTDVRSKNKIFLRSCLNHNHQLAR